MNGLFFTDEINECLDSKAFIAHIAPVSDEKVHRISFVFSCQDEDKILRIIFDNTSATFKL